MALTLHVSGTAHIMSRTASALGLEELGVSQDGVTITLETFYDDVHTDHYGQSVPYDKQIFLQTAWIEMDLIWYDNAVLAKWLQGAPFNSTSTIVQAGLGKAAWAGDLVLQNNECAGLVIRSTPSGFGLTGDGAGFSTSETCWNFFNVVLVDQTPSKKGVEKTIYHCKFQALYNQATSASFQTGLFNFSCT